ncbi:hypothetical protein ACFP2T_34395 [Plantactinospora solaniradicis]|uniref:Uncharacterized protein n=1 Tax=Plantactinospora solaniradicis TaxID=1723736 RepID=A0ABW1KJI2_9ACTN
MADRTPVDVILPCLDEADVSLPVLLGEDDRTGWWAIATDDVITADDDVRPGVAEPGVAEADPGRESYGRGPAVGGTRAGTR